ncbi:MAG: ABC transporter substrate-binding protein [Sneathiella sp.]|nr:ABC transporter substrate-binding protein [Sneathiella sp.]
MAFLRNFGLGLLVLFLSHAASGPAFAANHMERAERARATLDAMEEQARSILSEKGKSIAARENRLIQAIGKNFYFTLIGELVVGPEWAGLPQEQRREFLDLFKDFFLQAYGSQLGGYPGDKFVVLSSEAKGSNDSFVATKLIRPNRQPVLIVWRFREILGNPLIIDMTINGTSVALSHREGFHNVLQNDGMPGLITLFKIRAERLSADTRGFETGQELYEEGRFYEAFNIWQPLAMAGDAKAQFNLSVLYAQGRGIEPDTTRAEYWNNKALKAGYPPALHNHALTLLAAKENAAAIDLLHRAAGQAFVPSEYTLGQIYSYGIGVTEDPAQAFKYVDMAAKAGFAAAQYNLGKFYRDGYGVGADDTMSIDWFEKAALQGHAKAQDKLAARFEAGKGLPKDNVAALKWSILAGEGGVEEAASREKGLRTRMSATDTAHAEILAREFKAQ